MKSHSPSVFIFRSLVVCMIAALLSGCNSSDQPESTSIVKIQPAIQTQSAPLDGNLSANGPWILLTTKSGLSLINSDGSGLTELTLIEPDKVTVSPTGAYVAYLAFAEKTGWFIDILHLPDGQIASRIMLTTAETKPPDESQQMCEPKYEAARALTWKNNMVWSPDGKTLAFVGLLTGPSADVFIFSLEDKSIKQLTDEDLNAAHLNWSPSGTHIEYFGVSCFGSGVGVGIEQVLAVKVEDLTRKVLYKMNPESDLETFIGWTNDGRDAFFVSSQNYMTSCNEGLRMIDIEAETVRIIHKGCFEDTVTGRDNTLAVLTKGGFLSSPVVFLYSQPQENNKSTRYRVKGEVRNIVYDPNADLFLIRSLAKSGIEVYSMTVSGASGWYQGKDSFPEFSPRGEFWAWNENEKFHLSGKEIQSPMILNDMPGLYAFWHEEVDASGEVHQRIYFFSGTNGDEFYSAASPDYRPTLLISGQKPLSEPVIVYP